MVRAIPLSWPGLIGKCRFIFFGYSHWSLTGWFGIIENTNLGKAAFCTVYCSLRSHVGEHGCCQQSEGTAKFKGIESATSKMAR